MDTLPMLDWRAVTEDVKGYAKSVGFDLVAVTTADAFDDARDALIDRIERGLFEGLPWFTRERAEMAAAPRRHVPTARAILSLGMSYLTTEPESSAESTTPSLQGLVARYAWGQDYHDVIEPKLDQVAEHLRTLGGERAKVFVDHGRMVDRAVAQRSGLGWFGKNTNILTREHGSWVFLAAIVTDLPLVPDQPVRTNCGNCTACITACPTGAIVDEYTIDNDRCISYLTIELRGSIPRQLRPLIGTWVFGCDICQDVCPVNRKAHRPDHLEFAASAGIGARPDLIELLGIDEEQFRKRFRGTPIWRTKRRGLLRNVAVALGNLKDRAAVPALEQSLLDEEPIVRGHAAWALGRIGGARAREALLAVRDLETDPEVQAEIELALEEIEAAGCGRPTTGSGQ